MIDRLLNYGFAILLIALFVLYSDATGRIWLIGSVILCSAFVFVAFINNYFTIDGAGAALVVAIISVGLGGWFGAAMLLFFYSGTHVLAWWFEIADHPEIEPRKHGMQIWSASFWFVLFIALYYIFDEIWLIVTASSAMATTAAVIWMAITDRSFSDQAKLITTLRQVPSGTAGSVSYQGTLTAAAAVLIVALIFLFVTLSLDIRAGATIVVAGFSGCLADSYLCAIFIVHKSAKRWLSDHLKKTKLDGLQRLIPDRMGSLFLAAGLASAIAMLLY